jgi:hypothetical protein
MSKFTTHEAVESFMQWVRNTPELEGSAIAFGIAAEAGDVATVIGGHVAESPAFDDIAMRMIYNIEQKRQHLYESSHEVETLDRTGAEDGHVLN